MGHSVSIPLRTGLGFEPLRNERGHLAHGVSIPLRTGLGFEPPLRRPADQPAASQSPYERVSDSNKRIATWTCGRTSLNPLTNGSRIRTPPRRETVNEYQGLNPLTNGSRIRTKRNVNRIRNGVVSIPLRTGLGFEPRHLRALRACGQRLNPLTNGSRIRTRAASMACAAGHSLNPLTNGSRIRTVIGPFVIWWWPRVSIPLRTGLGFERISGGTERHQSVSIPLRTGLGFEPRVAVWVPQGTKSQSPYERVSDSNRPKPDRLTGPEASQSPYERVSDSNTLVNGICRLPRIVSIPLRTGLGFERRGD